MSIVDYALIIIVSYGLGSIPFGLLLTRFAGLGDVRALGSGNIGATNVLRTGRRDLAFLTFACDAGKAAVAIMLFRALFGEIGAALAGLGAFLGHVFPVWLKFRGGKGVASFFGIWFFIDWRIGVIAALVWLGVALVSQISSLSALIAVALTPICAFSFGDPFIFIGLAIVLLGVIYWRHVPNLQRLIRGEEPAMHEKSPANFSCSKSAETGALSS